eukprot:SAG11_NODE_12754_length_687_cov_0.619048_1_plen_27_part_10
MVKQDLKAKTAKVVFLEEAQAKAAARH